MESCRWCGMAHGPHCPMVKAIEYFESGAVRRVEFKCIADEWPVVLPPGTHIYPWPNTTSVSEHPSWAVR